MTIYNNPTALNMFEAKWQRRNLVSTNYQETLFLNQSNNKAFPFLGRIVPEKYTYYYHTLEIEQIISEWKKNCPAGISLTHKIHRIGSDIDIPDLVKLLSPELGAKISRIHQLTIKSANNNKVSKKKCLLIAGTHAREVASVTSLIAFVDNLLSNKSAYTVLDQWSLDVILLMNPLGYFIDNNRTYATLSGEIHNEGGIYHRKNDRNIKVFNLPKLMESSHVSLKTVRNTTSMVNTGDCGAEIPSRVLDVHCDANHPRTAFVTRPSLDVGVDLNRNNGLDFVQNGKKYSGWVGGGTGEVNPGVSPNSERETQIFQKVFREVQPDLFITIHGYGNMIVTSDVYDDSATMSNQLKILQKQYKIKFDQKKNVPSCYRLSQLIGDFEFYRSIVKDVKLKGVVDGARSTGEWIQFPTDVSPLGVATGDMTFWSYCYYENQKRTKPYIGFTLELGSNGEDGFYPNKYQMIDIVYNAYTVIWNSLGGDTAP